MQAEQQTKLSTLENGDADGSDSGEFEDCEVFEAPEDKVERNVEDTLAMVVEQTTEALHSKVDTAIDRVRTKLPKLIDRYVNKKTCAYIWPNNYRENVKLRGLRCPKECLPGEIWCGPEHKRVGNQNISRKRKVEQERIKDQSKKSKDESASLAVQLPSVPDKPAAEAQVASDEELAKKLELLKSPPAADAKYEQSCKELDKLLGLKELEKQEIAKYRGELTTEQTGYFSWFKKKVWG